MKVASRSRATRALLLVCLCALTLWKIASQRLVAPERDVMQALRETPVVDTGGKVLGNPQNAVSDLKSIYQSVSTFRRKYHRYPESSMELLNDMAPNPQDYGFANRKEAEASLKNPDVINQRPKLSKKKAEQVIAYQMRFRRFNGQPLGSTKEVGKRDVLAWTSDYYFPNTKTDWSNIDSSTMNPVGFYLVLWDDGQVQRVPFDKILQVPIGNNEWQVGFRGQAGLAKGFQTFDEFHKDSISYQNWKRTQARKAGASSSNP